MANPATGTLAPVHLVDGPMRYGFCSFASYKDPANIPKKYYRRIGKEEPVPKEKPVPLTHA